MHAPGRNHAAAPPSGAPHLNPPGPVGRSAACPFSGSTTRSIQAPRLARRERRRRQPLLDHRPSPCAQSCEIDAAPRPAGPPLAPLDEQTGTLHADTVDRVGPPAVTGRTPVVLAEPDPLRHRKTTSPTHAARH